MENDTTVVSIIDKSTTAFTLTLTVPTCDAESTRRYLTIPALGLGANLLERRHDWWSDGGQVITHMNVVVEGKLV